MSFGAISKGKIFSRYLAKLKTWSKRSSWVQEIRTFIKTEMPISGFLRSVRINVSTCKPCLDKTESHISKNFLPTKVFTVHSFLEALPMPDFSRLSHSSSSGGEVSILPFFASRTRTKTLDVCIARYCRNLRVAGSLRLMFAHIKLRTSMMA